MSISDFELAQIISSEEPLNTLLLEYHLFLANRSLLTATKSLNNAAKSIACAKLGGISPSPSGTHVLESWRLLQTAIDMLMNGPLVILDTPPTKPIRNLIKLDVSRVPPPVHTSPESNQPHAKLARTGKKSKARSRLVSDVISPKIKYKVTRYNKPPRP